MNLRLFACSALAMALSATALHAKAGDIDADKSKRRAVTDPMDASDCPTIYRAAGGRYFPQAASHTSYKQSDCDTPLFWDGGLPNSDRHAANFKSLPICLGMQENINYYLGKYPGKCRRLTSSAWSQDLNQKFIWCIAKGYLKGGAIWLANNRMMSKGWAQKKLTDGAPRGFDSLFVTASEACFWHKVMGRTFPLSGKDKAAQTAAKKSTARSKSSSKGHGSGASSSAPSHH